MGIARNGFTATTLSNGKVLVAGGYAGGVGLASAELYDPASGTWEVTGSLATGRGGHTATLLPDGKVLVVGGTRYTLMSSDIGSAELYDPASGTWTTTGVWGPGAGHAAVLLPNGQVLVVGGFVRTILGGGSTHGGAALFDPANGTWTTTGSLATGRSGHTATLLPNGKVLVAGGTNSVFGFPNLGILASAELYDPTSGTWTPTGNLTAARSAHGATLLPDGKVLVAGGLSDPPQGVPVALATAELYDPVSETWLATGSLGAARYFHTMTLLPSGQVLVAGGFYSYDRTNSRASAELYHPASGIWVATGSLISARDRPPGGIAAQRRGARCWRQ